MYKFTLYLDCVVPGFTEDDGALRFRVSCRSLRGAEKYARQHAAIVSRHGLVSPARCLIEYKTQAGVKRHEITFEEEKDTHD